MNQSTCSVLRLGSVSLESSIRSFPREFGARGRGGGRGEKECGLLSRPAAGNRTHDELRSFFERLTYHTVKLIWASLSTEKNCRLGIFCLIHRSVFSLLISGYRVIVDVTGITHFVYPRFQLISSLKDRYLDR